MGFKRWVILLLLSCSGFTLYYSYDSVTSIDYLLKQNLGLDASQFGLLYSFYSVANVFFLALFFAGILLDLWGYRKSGFLFMSLCLLGTLITAYGGSPGLIPGSLKHFLDGALFPGVSAELKLMLLGRMIFGMGSEALNITAMKILATWFGHRLAFAFAFAITFYRFGSFSALNLQVWIAKLFGLESALWFSGGVVAFGWLLFVIFLLVEKSRRHTIVEMGEGTHYFSLKEVGRFPGSLWYLAIICITFYGALQTFEIFDPDILKNRFSYSPTESGFVSSVSLIGTLIFTPLIGYCVDKFGKRATFMSVGSMMIFLGLVWLMFFQIPLVPVFIIGVSYSFIAASLWASIPLVVERNYQGTALGIVSYVQNMGLMLFPWLAGVVADLYTRGRINYVPVLFCFSVLALISLLFSILLKIKDKKGHRAGAQSLEKV